MRKKATATMMRSWTAVGARFCIGLAATALIACSDVGESLGSRSDGLGPCGVPPTGGSSGIAVHCFNSDTDATIVKADPTTNYGTLSVCHVAGGGLEPECLMRFGLSFIPVGTTVTAASLLYTVADSSADGATAYPLVRTWSEAQATWNVASTGVSWGTPGAKATSDRGATPFAAVSTSMGFHEAFPNLAVVQGWVNTPSSNKGLVIANASNDLTQIYTREATGCQQPLLCLTY